MPNTNGPLHPETEAKRAGYWKPVRVAHLISHPIQYFAPLYRELSSRPEIDLTVYFYSDLSLREFDDAGFGARIRWDVPLTGGYKCEFLPSSRGARVDGALFSQPNWDLLRHIAKARYDVIWVHCYAHPNAWLARLIASACGSRFLIREEQTLIDSRPLYKRIAKQIVLRSLFKGSFALCIGEANRRYFAHYGLRQERIFSSHYCVDNEYFSSRASQLLPERDGLRKRFGIDTADPVILFCGKFIEKKQPMLLMEAFDKVRRQTPCWLLMVGTGPLLEATRRFVTECRTPGVIMPGFMNQTELPEAYAASDIFVLPSAFQETWGLVVNEAMNFSLPVIVSDRVGCGENLVHHGLNGFIFPHDNPDALAKCLTSLLSNASMRREFGARSASIVADYGVVACADGVVEGCLAAACEKERSRGGLFRRIRQVSSGLFAW